MFDYELYLLEEKAYKEQNADLFQYTNPHPQGCLVGDCVKRAITIATGTDYNQVSLELNRHKKLTGAKVFNENKNWESYVTKVAKAKKVTGWANTKVGEFCKQNKTGRFILSIRKHVVAVVDGKILDTWNCSYKAIGKVYKVERMITADQIVKAVNKIRL